MTPTASCPWCDAIMRATDDGLTELVAAQERRLEHAQHANDELRREVVELTVQLSTATAALTDATATIERQNRKLRKAS